MIEVVQEKQYSNGVVIPLHEPTSDTRALIHAAYIGLQHIFRPGYWYKKASVMLMEISKDQIRQGSLFDGSPSNLIGEMHS